MSPAKWQKLKSLQSGWRQFLLPKFEINKISSWFQFSTVWFKLGVLYWKKKIFPRLRFRHNQVMTKQVHGQMETDQCQPYTHTHTHIESNWWWFRVKVVVCSDDCGRGDGGDGLRQLIEQPTEYVLYIDSICVINLLIFDCSSSALVGRPTDHDFDHTAETFDCHWSYVILMWMLSIWMISTLKRWWWWPKKREDCGPTHTHTHTQMRIQ